MRPSRDQIYLAMAKKLAERRTCARRAVGCILVDVNGDILAQGYNGVAADRPHCNEIRLRHMPTDDADDMVGKPEYFMPFKCEGANAPSGQNLDACQAIHAEQNAILRCKDYRAIHTAYVTASPCISCVKLLLGTPCSRIVFAEEYPQPTAKTWWTEAGREWIFLPT